MGSNFAWQGISSLRWQASPGLGPLLAYQYLYNDYDEGRGDDDFEYDMAMHGSTFGRGIHLLIVTAALSVDDRSQNGSVRQLRRQQ